MTAHAVSYPIPTDTPATADLRAAAHAVDTAARIALLLLAAELALDTLPEDAWRNQAADALVLAGCVPAGEPVDVGRIYDAMHSEYDEGAVVYAQLVPDSPQAVAWEAIGATLGYAAWRECQRRGEHPNSLIEGYSSPDALDFTIDSFIGVPGLDWATLAGATAWIREHASKANEGWGQPLRAEDLRSVAAGPAKAG